MIAFEPTEDSSAAVNLVASGIRNYAEVCDRDQECVPIDLNFLVDSVIGELRAEIDRCGTQIHVGRLPKISGDPFQMAWLVRELLTNALRFGAADSPRVEVSLTAGGPVGWFVSVTDNGSGIDPNLSERVFLPFKRLAGCGAGLGLAICRRIVELHGGQIWMEPREGGAEVRFFIGEPAANAPCD